MKIFLRLGLLIAIAGLAILFFILDPAKNALFPRCIFYTTTGYYCPGCGSQRAIHSLLHLNFTGVIGNNFLFLPAILLILYHYSHPVINKLFNWRLPNILYFKSAPWIILGVIVFFWIIRNIPVYPFSILAPD